jgi:hypothetical protein
MPRDLEIQEIAYLLGAEWRFSCFMVLNLMERGFLVWHVKAEKLLLQDKNQEVLTLKERQVLRIIANDGSMEQVNELYLPEITAIKERLLKEYGVISHSNLLEQTTMTRKLTKAFGIGFKGTVGCIVLAMIIRNIIEPLYEWLFDRHVPHFMMELVSWLGHTFIYLFFVVMLFPIIIAIGLMTGESRRELLQNETRVKQVLEKYLQQMPDSGEHSLHDSLSKAYAFYGDSVLTDPKFKGLRYFLQRRPVSPM